MFSIWPNYNYYYLLENIYQINQDRALNEKIKLFPLDVMFSWDSIRCDGQYNMFLDMMEPQNNYPPVIDRNTIMAQHFIRKWDASFKFTGNKNVGFDMKETPFGKTKFDMYNFGGNAYETVYFEYIFDGLVFYEPIENFEIVIGIPGLFDDSTFFEEFYRRIAVEAGMTIEAVKSSNEIRNYINDLNVKKADKIDILGIDNDRYNLSDYNCQINKWMTK
jgi:hypothetical protein